MPTQVPKVRVEGLAELQRAFKVAGGTLSKELRKGLRDAVEPVKTDAEILAATRIGNMAPPKSDGAQDWRRMRIGVTATMVYVAPRSKRGPLWRRRSNLFDLLLGRSLEPALDANINEVESRLDDVLGTVGQAWNRA